LNEAEKPERLLEWRQKHTQQQEDEVWKHYNITVIA